MAGHALDQDTVWVDKHGNRHAIKDMSGRYALNVYNLLSRNAQVVGLKYANYLATVTMPDVYSEAFDAVESAIDNELVQITEDPLTWLTGKPLMKALAARVEADPASSPRANQLAPEAAVEFSDLVTLPAFQVKPPVEPLPSWDYRPGDEAKVFMVTSGSYDSYSVLALFVGNRQAAFRYAAEHDRYSRDAVVEELDDTAVGSHAARRYPDPYTEVTFVAEVEFDTGDVVYQRVSHEVRQGDAPEISIDARLIKRHRLESDRVLITTTGPEYRLDEVKAMHRERVFVARRSVAESASLFLDADQ